MAMIWGDRNQGTWMKIGNDWIRLDKEINVRVTVNVFLIAMSVICLIFLIISDSDNVNLSSTELFYSYLAIFVAIIGGILGLISKIFNRIFWTIIIIGIVCFIVWLAFQIANYSKGLQTIL